MAEVELTKVRKVYPNGYLALHDLTLSVADGEFLVLVGPSGCGKSTALQMIAGLESVTGGEIRIGDRVVNDEPPKRRDVAMVFQDYALYPHMTVAKNIGFPLELAKTSRADTRRRVADAARVLGLEQQLHKRPGQLSGGQKQRVAMGRAIVRRPAVFLMDEPLSNLDAKLRVQMRVEIARIQSELEATTIYVTHDQVEAMTMGDRVAVMLDGTLQQIDTPRALYAAPVNVFVAGFIGSPAMNLMRSQVESADGGYSLPVGSTRLFLPGDDPRTAPLHDHIGRDVVVGIRPECLTPTSDDVGTTNVIGGRVRVAESLGAEVLVHIGTDARRFHIVEDIKDDAAREELGADLLDLAHEDEAVVIARFDADTAVRKGNDVRVGADPAKVHVFDGATGCSLLGR